jgi:hypothetical protein
MKKGNLMIRKSILLFLIISSTFFVVTISFGAEEKKDFSGEVSVSALSQYIWRGQELSRHSMVLQPSFTLGYKGFSANIWGNWDSAPYFKGKSHWNETDYTLSYENEYRLLNYGVGFMHYDMVDEENSQEVCLKLGLNVLLNPTLTVYKEIEHDLYTYFLFAVSHSIPLSKRLELSLSASAGYLVSDDAVEYPEIDKHGQETGRKFKNIHDGTLTVSLPYVVFENFTITPTLSYTFPLCSEARREMKYFSMTGHDSDFLYGGLIFTYSF